MKPTARKLFPHHPPSKPLPDPCTSFCNPTQNFFRACPSLCIPLCPAFCQPFPDFLRSPQPPSPPSVHTAATDCHPHHHHHNYLSPVFIAMIVFLASAFAVVISYLIYSTFFSSPRSLPRRQRSGRVPEFDHSLDMLNFHPVWYIATVGLQRSTVESIGVCEYKKGDGLVQGMACIVCLAEFQDGDALRLLPKCCHAFHVPCIDTWFASHTTCPICRTPVLQGNNISLQSPRVEARLVEVADDPSSSREVSGVIAGEVEDGEARGPMRRAASMDSLGLEVGEKMNTCASGSNSLGERSLSCTGKLFSSRNGLR